MSEGSTRIVRGEADVEAAFREPLAVVYKHSPLCGLSDIAAREIGAFSEARPDVPVYTIDVIRDRPVARAVASRTSVRHESPQAFVLRAGEVVWHDSHRGVTAEALEREVGRLPDEATGS